MLAAIEVVPEWYLALGAVLFAIGAFGLLVRRNPLVMFMCVELMLNAVNLLLVAFNRLHPENHAGQMFAFFVIAGAAAAAAVGLAIVIALFRHRESLSPEAFTNLKW